MLLNRIVYDLPTFLILWPLLANTHCSKSCSSLLSIICCKNASLSSSLRIYTTKLLKPRNKLVIKIALTGLGKLLNTVSAFFFLYSLCSFCSISIFSLILDCCCCLCDASSLSFFVLLTAYRVLVNSNFLLQL